MLRTDVSVLCEWEGKSDNTAYQSVTGDTLWLIFLFASRVTVFASRRTVIVAYCTISSN